MNWRELILGPAYLYHHRLIKESYTWSQSDIIRFLERKKKQFQNENDYTISSKADILKAPKQYELKNHLTKEVTTGGTSGEPFQFKIDLFSRRQKERAYIHDIWRTVGYKPFSLRVIIRGNINKKLISYNMIENAYIINPSLLRPNRKSEVKSFLHTLPPFYIHCYPSSLLRFIDYIGYNYFRDLKACGILAGSETFPKNQMDWFRNTLGLEIAHWYGHSEYAVLAKYCTECRGFHFYPTYGLAEFEPNNNGTKSIIATSYNILGTRFIRYNTGDLVKLDSITCKSCLFPRVASIIGREQETIIDKYRQSHAFGPLLFGIHGNFWKIITDVQFIQDSPGIVMIMLVGVRDKNKSWIEKYLKNRFALMECKFFYVDKISKTKRGKHKYFINKMI
ncbi:hypothetical protein ACFL02_03180 [Planctomycetota bacterium]